MSPYRPLPFPPSTGIFLSPPTTQRQAIVLREPRDKEQTGEAMVLIVRDAAISKTAFPRGDGGWESVSKDHRWRLCMD